MFRWMQLALNELDFQIKCIYNRSSVISSYDLPLTTNIKTPEVCHNRSRKYLITSQVSEADVRSVLCQERKWLGLICIFSHKRVGVVLQATVQTGNIMYWGLRTLNIILFLLFSLVCVSSEFHNLQRVFSSHLWHKRGVIVPGIPSGDGGNWD